MKRLPDIGQPHESVVVQGVACKKNVAHRRMRSQVSNSKELDSSRQLLLTWLWLQ